jgi:translation initiation factor 4E
MNDNTLEKKHELYDKWTFWAHLPHDTDWSLSSYQKLVTISSLEEVVTINNIIPNEMVCNCMLFVMRNGINPLWEDSHNRDGGSFSFKIDNSDVAELWKEMVYKLVGEDLFINENSVKKITGVTISPKKNFCILKIWIKDCSEQNVSKLNINNKLNVNGCLFKKHIAGKNSSKSSKIY